MIAWNFWLKPRFLKHLSLARKSGTSPIYPGFCKPGEWGVENSRILAAPHTMIYSIGLWPRGRPARRNSLFTDFKLNFLNFSPGRPAGRGSFLIFPLVFRWLRPKSKSKTWRQENYGPLLILYVLSTLSEDVGHNGRVEIESRKAPSKKDEFINM